MKLGIVFPQADIGADPNVIRAFAPTHLCLSAGRGIPAAQQLETAIRMKQVLTGVL